LNNSGYWGVAIKRDWFRNKAVLVADQRGRKIASRPLPVVANVGYNSNSYFTEFVVIAALCFVAVLKKFYKSKKTHKKT
jgi:hypothetical protein